MADWKERLDEFDRDLAASREISRTAIYRIIILSASIVGFSVSLFSIPSLQSSLEVGTIRYSWYCFLAAIIIGFFILMLEGRVKYAKTWKGFQVSRFPENLRKPDYTYKERFFAFLITIFSLVCPANLVFNRIYEKEEEKEFKERVNGIVVNKLAAIEHGLLFMENVLFITFTAGLVLLVTSFRNN